MSYDFMDHAGWVEQAIAMRQKHKPTAIEARNAAEGKGWHAAPKRLNEFHHRALTILGIIGGGIYNAPILWGGVYWAHPYILVAPWRGHLATFDFQGLTDAVLLAHDARIRLEIRARGQSLELLLHNRGERDDSERLGNGHPSLEQATAAHRARFPFDHPIHCSLRVPERLLP